jgi:hypothetical protein
MKLESQRQRKTPLINLSHSPNSWESHSLDPPDGGCRISDEAVEVTICRNESTPDDYAQANALRALVMDNCVVNRTYKLRFKREYLNTIPSWGVEQFEKRLTALNHPEGAKRDGPRSAIRPSNNYIRKRMNRQGNTRSIFPRLQCSSDASSSQLHTSEITSEFLAILRFSSKSRAFESPLRKDTRY